MMFNSRHLFTSLRVDLTPFLLYTFCLGIGLAPSIPEDLWHLVKKAVAVRKHLEVNRKDKDSKFRLILIESRIHRLARYYKTEACRFLLHSNTIVLLPLRSLHKCNGVLMASEGIRGLGIVYDFTSAKLCLCQLCTTPERN